MPPFPYKHIIKNEANLAKRRRDLEAWLNFLIGRPETRHSAPVIKFFSLKEYCPELIHNQPDRQLSFVVEKPCSMTHCLVVNGLTIQVTGVKKSLKSFLEIVEYHDDYMKQNLLLTTCVGKIKALDYYEKDGILCLGLQSGSILLVKFIFNQTKEGPLNPYRGSEVCQESFF